MFLAVWREFMEGRGPVYLKLDHLPEETLKGLEKVLWGTERTVRGQFHQTAQRRLPLLGLRGTGHGKKSPCAPATATPAFMVNKDTETTVPGLFAAGEITGGIHGRNRIGGNGLADAFTFGMIAAENLVSES